MKEIIKKCVGTGTCTQGHVQDFLHVRRLPLPPPPPNPQRLQHPCQYRYQQYSIQQHYLHLAVPVPSTGTNV